CDQPSTRTVSVRAGKDVCGWIVHQSLPGVFMLSGMAKVIVSAPGAAFASRIACRSEPGPPSSVVVTVKTAGANRSSSPSTPGRKDWRRRIGRVRSAFSLAARGRNHEERRMGLLHRGFGLRYNGGQLPRARRPDARALHVLLSLCQNGGYRPLGFGLP